MYANMLYNNEMGAGWNLPPFLTTNPYIGDMAIMAEQQLLPFPPKKQATKICTQCGVEKPISMFNRDRTHRDGLQSRCKLCKQRCDKAYYENTKEERIKYQHANYNTNKHTILQQQHDYYIKHRDVILLYQKTYKQNNQDKVREYRKRTKEHISEYNKKYAETYCQMPKIKERRREQWKTKYYNDLNFKLNHRIRTEIGRCLNGTKNRQSWQSIVGYSLEDLKKHLEKQFKPGMSWDNYNFHGWHIDHKTPLSVFNFTKPEHPDFKKAWSLKNLQPMWAKDNWSKGGKLDKPFQPCLLLERMK